jgi:RNA polymerase sigma-70 factor (ECF subfamily)
MKVSEVMNRDYQLVDVFNDVNSTNRQKQSAFENIYSLYHKNIIFFIERKIRDKETAEDLMMITFEKVHKHIGDYDSTKGAFSTWLYRIATNSMIDFFRSKTLSTKLSTTSLDHGLDEEFTVQVASDSLTPEQELIKKERAEKVREAISLMKRKDTREIFIQRFINGYSDKETRKMLNYEENSSTMRVKFVRGKDELRKIIGNLEI